MADYQLRMGERRFYDDKAFPRGFAKSGNFTLVEEELLIYYGQTMLALEQGSLLPENAEEKHFLKALKDPKKANSKLETVWLKYIKFARGRKQFHTLNSKKSSASNNSNWVDSSDDAMEYEAAE
ncbi:DUF413 domain-containing protein [Vibrio sp. SCSIO 43136]|uniref:DUF413 domain-containing protein n=1 Tax=Vibrio sp. SCSIO 43136 TaxID=2819101 RepID=UPI00207644FF|nr:DUF413 domain-containing protein [Vibrio sp. SCSIO 43136]USD67594.1 DUF413 domain-containing protein [Vibrio sp. SCSIO 43136]